MDCYQIYSGFISSNPASRELGSDPHFQRFFRSLDQDRLKRGVFGSVNDLIAAIEQYVGMHNENPKPFIWTKTARDILRKVIRAREKLKTVQTA